MGYVSNRSDDLREFKDAVVMKAVCREARSLNHQASFQYSIVFLTENGRNGDVINSGYTVYVGALPYPRKSAVRRKSTGTKSTFHLYPNK